MALTYEWGRARVLTALATHVRVEMQRRVLEAALALTEGLYKANVLTALASQATGEMQEQILKSISGPAAGSKASRDTGRAGTAADCQAAQGILGDYIHRIKFHQNRHACWLYSLRN